MEAKLTGRRGRDRYRTVLLIPHGFLTVTQFPFCEHRKVPTLCFCAGMMGF